MLDLGSIALPPCLEVEQVDIETDRERIGNIFTNSSFILFFCT